MEKQFLAVTAALCMVLTFTACGNATDSGTENHTVDKQAENEVDIQQEPQEDIQVETQVDEQEQPQGDINTENQPDIREDNEAVSTQDIDSAADDNKSGNEEGIGEQTDMKMNVQVGDYNFTATLENNAAVEELVEMMKEGPVTISMGDYSGFEKVGSLGRSLTTSNSQTTTDAGDIVLYNGNNIVMFYGSNSWSYTRIGKIDDLTDWKKALGSGSITAVFTLAE